MILPSSRSLTACPHDGQRPVSPVLEPAEAAADLAELPLDVDQ
jgi:hypothetical protein